MINGVVKYPRILAVALSTRGFGFAVLDGVDTLVDWGVKSVSGDKNAGSISKLEALLSHYNPEVIVLEDFIARKRAPRIRRLARSILTQAGNKDVKITLFTRKEMREAFSDTGQSTKQGRAAFIAQKFPDEIGFRLPPKRKPWMSESYSMDIFEAVALAVMGRYKPAK
jgi:hypothetical protein